MNFVLCRALFLWVPTMLRREGSSWLWPFSSTLDDLPPSALRTGGHRSASRTPSASARRSPRFLGDNVADAGPCDVTHLMALPAGSRRGSVDSAGAGLPEFLRSMSAAFSRAGSIFSLRSSSSGSVRSPQQTPPVPPNSSAVPALPSDPHNNSASAVHVAGKLGLFANMTSPRQTASPNGPRDVSKASTVGADTFVQSPTGGLGLFRPESWGRRESAPTGGLGLFRQDSWGLGAILGQERLTTPADGVPSLQEYCRQHMGIQPADLKPNALARIQDLCVLFRTLVDKGIIRLECAGPGRINSIFGFERIMVENCDEFNAHFLDMIQADSNRCTQTPAPYLTSHHSIHHCSYLHVHVFSSYEHNGSVSTCAHKSA